MQKDDVVLVLCGLGYRPAVIKNIGKRKTEVTYADEKTEWVENKRVWKSENFEDRCWMERTLYESKYIHEKEEEKNENEGFV